MKQPIFIFAPLLGAMDGLDVVIPRGDPEFNVYRSKFPFAGEMDLDGFFTLHGKCNVLHNMVGLKEASFVHAVGTTYADRSHFDGQRVLQSGGDTPMQLKTGWVNRLMTAINNHGYVAKGASVVPGTTSTFGTLGVLGDNSISTFGERVTKLTAVQQTRLQEMWKSDTSLMSAFDQMVLQGDMTPTLTSPARIAELSALGYNVFYTEFGGFDTHTSQSWPLSGAIDAVDEFIGNLKAAMGERWNDVIFFGASEFGRGFYPNANAGTDHGVGNVVILAGGALKEWNLAPVITKWPGLTKEKLYQGRDLMPTKDMRSVTLAVVCRLFGLDP